MAQAVRLSVSIIAKDEEANIGDCIESIKGADEIIVLDTGSMDNTVRVAKEHGAKTYFMPWGNDFSSARNRADRYCTGEWTLSIDCDERLVSPLGGIREAIRERGGPYIDVKLEYDSLYHFFPRLYETTGFDKWKHSTHNRLKIWGGQRRPERDITFDCHRSISHREDPNRALRMLEKAHTEDPGCARYIFYLGMEYATRHDWEKALTMLTGYDEIGSRERYLAESALMQAKVYRQLGDEIRALSCAREAWNINSNFKEAAEFAAFLNMDNSRESGRWIARARAANNDNVLFVRKRSWLELFT